MSRVRGSNDALDSLTADFAAFDVRFSQAGGICSVRLCAAQGLPLVRDRPVDHIFRTSIRREGGEWLSLLSD